MSNLADSHLTYIGTEWQQLPVNRTGVHACYDVYNRDGGPQKGWVYRRYGIWVAMSADPEVPSITRPTRWEAATEMWGAWPA